MIIIVFKVFFLLLSLITSIKASLDILDYAQDDKGTLNKFTWWIPSILWTLFYLMYLL